MKLTDVIKKMQRAKKEHGDLEVVGVFEVGGEFGYSWVPYLEAVQIQITSDPTLDKPKLQTVFAVAACPVEDDL